MRDGRALYESVPGFRGSLLLFDRERLKARSITLWRDTRDMDAAATHPDYATTMASLASHFASAPDVEMWTLGGSFFSAEGDDGASSDGATADRQGDGKRSDVVVTRVVTR